MGRAGLAFPQESLQLHKRPHPTHLHRWVRHVKSRLLRRVGVVRGPAHGHQGMAGMRVVEVDGRQQGERPGRAHGVAGRVARFVCKRVQPHQAPGWRDVFEQPFAPHLRAVGALHASLLFGSKEPDRRFGLALSVFSDELFDGIEYLGKLLVVAGFHGLNPASQISVGVHQAA